MTRQVGKIRVITCVFEAGGFIVYDWPGEQTEKLDIAKHALAECLDGKMSSSGVACMAFIEATKEADIYIEAARRPSSTCKECRGKRKPARHRA